MQNSKSPIPPRRSTSPVSRIEQRPKRIGAKVRVPVPHEVQDDFRVAEDAVLEVEDEVIVLQDFGS